MLHDDIKKAVDSGDISSLKYIFSTCLDGDPTFDKYIEDYEYCKSKGVLFVPHIDIHPMTLDFVDEKYWVQLQKDFRDNPSIERLEHMREVAKILYKDRISNASETVKKPLVKPTTAPPLDSVSKPVQRDTVQTSRIEQPKPVLRDNTGKGDSNATEGDGIIRRKEPVKKPEPTSRPQQGGTLPKKASGVGCLIILAFLVVAVIVVVMICQNK